MPGNRQNARKGDIASDAFKGDNALTADNWADLECVAPSDAPRRLLDNWSGGVMGYMHACLENDNSGIATLTFHLRGSMWESPIARSAESFWRVNQPELGVRFNCIESGLFEFKSGTLISDLVDCSKVPYNLVKNGVALSDEEMECLELPGFCLRALVVPISDSWATLSVLLFPMKKQALLANMPLAKQAAFPGLLLFKGDIPLGFNSSDLLPDVDCGLPFLPSVSPGRTIFPYFLGFSDSS